jgi:sulfur carrier protein ThiS
MKELKAPVLTIPHAEIKHPSPRQPKQPTPLKQLIAIRPRLEGKQFVKRLNEGRERVVVYDEVKVLPQRRRNKTELRSRESLCTDQIEVFRALSPVS